ncbi:hypothetical protein EH165_10865 [Nakamurella antarctica]|uniref:Uncharacterized protein n=1 Tax=Nakamurella antarctica TaxID=1902245 RepID=A0A3G8ZWZ9_9ACTN|nr:hypothetical protein [Nakamurella antarctica]AZI58556.1 hypothetical protein EH165_10865 [Nakamurella antarctica]
MTCEPWLNADGSTTTFFDSLKNRYFAVSTLENPERYVSVRLDGVQEVQPYFSKKISLPWKWECELRFYKRVNTEPPEFEQEEILKLALTPEIYNNLEKGRVRVLADGKVLTLIPVPDDQEFWVFQNVITSRGDQYSRRMRAARSDFDARQILLSQLQNDVGAVTYDNKFDAHAGCGFVTFDCSGCEGFIEFAMFSLDDDVYARLVFGSTYYIEGLTIHEALQILELLKKKNFTIKVNRLGPLKFIKLEFEILGADSQGFKAGRERVKVSRFAWCALEAWESAVYN